MKREIELLAPAGNADALKAAVQSGADAVYIGGPRFNARQSAKNFGIEEIKTFADYCHLYGADLHVAVNTLIKERELGELLEYAYELNSVNVDALIVQDLGAARLIKEACPELPLHASTQMTVTSVEGVKYLEDMGFSRVVLARELSKAEIENIARHTKAEIEVFVHGALCMCYSGQCLMSSVIGGRSANRGRCAQPCRLPYELTDDNGEILSGYILSPKDLALADRLGELRDIGVKSLKIEGRLKRAEYVSAVTGIYRKYLDGREKVSREDWQELKNAFSRSGFTQGYFDGKTGVHMMSIENPANAAKNEFSDDAKKRAAKDANIRKIPVSIMGAVKENEYMTITVTDGDYNSVTVTGTQKAERARNMPLDAERIERQLKKLGQTPYEAEYAFADTDGVSVVSIKEINALRREACDKLTEERVKRAERLSKEVKIHGAADKRPARRLLITADCQTRAQAEVCGALGADAVYVSGENIGGYSDVTVEKEPVIFNYENTKAERVCVSSPAAARFYGDRKIYGGAALNVYNSYTADAFAGAELITLSPELNAYEIREAAANTAAKCEIIVYGRLTLMIMKNSPANFAPKNGGKRYFLRDRKNQKFPLLCEKDGTARLLNSKPIFVADRLAEILSPDIAAIRLVFTDEDKELTEKVFSAYKRALCGEKIDNIFKENEFTRGHYFRGVE
ncbi:MAG: U32 family peptidase [Firmicutes bacterium]|nr:U32 family peptidase [Bacillota bacterium]